MEQLARELARLAWQLERDAEEILDRATQPNRSDESTDAVTQRLVRIEGKVSDIHGHTSELIRRVPGDLGPVLAELKQVLITRLENVHRATHSHESAGSPHVDAANQANHSAQSGGGAIPALTPQERKVFEMCFRSGFLSYRDIASQLDITSTAAKNLDGPACITSAGLGDSPQDPRRPRTGRQAHAGPIGEDLLDLGRRVGWEFNKERAQARPESFLQHGQCPCAAGDAEEACLGQTKEALDDLLSLGGHEPVDVVQYDDRRSAAECLADAVELDVCVLGISPKDPQLLNDGPQDAVEAAVLPAVDVDPQASHPRRADCTHCLPCQRGLAASGPAGESDVQRRLAARQGRQ